MLDLDADNDGIPDLIEAGGIDANGDGVVDNANLPGWDDDLDGFTSWYDTDSDNDSTIDTGAVSLFLYDQNGDGTLDSQPTFYDFDRDGKPNHLDLDADNDGIYDIVESQSDGLHNSTIDPDRDGQLGSWGLPLADADGDGFGDVADPVDHSGGNIVGSPFILTADLDLDNNHLADSYLLSDFDSDNLPNFVDIDADNDGIVDLLESQPSSPATREPFASVVKPIGVDSDADGIDDALDVLNQLDGTAFAGTFVQPVNSDGDGTASASLSQADAAADYLDPDADNDTFSDLWEGHDADYDGNPDTAPLGIDSDQDGLDDAFDTFDLRSDAQPAIYNPIGSDTPVQDMDGDADGSVGSGNDRDWRDGGSSSFPIELIDFTGRLQGRDALLEWFTARESNSERFVVERSIDQKLYAAVGDVSAAGFSEVKKDYSYLDMKAANLLMPQLYYRLRMEDLDGAFERSKVVELHLEKANRITLFAFPNPSTDQLNIRYSAPGTSNPELRIVDAVGREVRRESVAGGPGVQLIQISVSEWTSGTYFVHLNNENYSSVFKIIVNP